MADWSRISHNFLLLSPQSSLAAGFACCYLHKTKRSQFSSPESQEDRYLVDMYILIIYIFTYITSTSILQSYMFMYIYIYIHILLHYPSSVHQWSPPFQVRSTDSDSADRRGSPWEHTSAGTWHATHAVEEGDACPSWCGGSMGRYGAKGHIRSSRQWKSSFSYDSLLLTMAIEIVSFPMNSMVIFHIVMWTFTRGYDIYDQFSKL